ncbi:molybdopterin-dependent oxidoreductase [Adlercreutzia sp. ZJ154]|uniref:molybdopterin-containing oxidoreductase family protein n=1 Tax=Adlercreutzia sp. ZJ154 TaxID=2709790 RepID=UPI0013EB58FD|nr:molybdopterin-dependent oxidoreductase [Adlercreutzia sp. ZJ154]
MSEEKKWITEEGDGAYKVHTCAWSPPGDHPVGCAMYLHVKDGKVVKVEGDPDSPITQGRLCPRCLALDEVMYSPKRITHPMVRDPKDRGKDKWKEVTWDEAYDLIESKVRDIWENYGPESIFTITGTGRESTLYAPAYTSSVLMSPNNANVLSGTSCYGPRCTIANYQLGAGYPELDYAAYFPDRYDDPRYEVPKYIMLWGKNPIYSSGDGFFGHAIIDLMKRGSKLIVVDPMVTWCATRAEYHLQLRPGTDAAVAMGMANVIIKEDLYDHEFVEKWCYGFDEFAASVAEWTPEKTAEVSWVDPDALVGAARAFATSKPSSAMWGLAIDTLRNGVQAGHTFLAIVALCGYFDIPGGVTLAKPTSFIGKWRYESILTLPEEIRNKRIVDLDGKYSCYNSGGAMPGVLADSLLNWLEMDNPPYPLKMGWWVGTNPLSCMGAVPQRWHDALMKVDFHVSNDIFMNASIMALCDVVLPLSTFAEHNGVVLPHFGRNTHFVGAMNKAVDPEDTKSDAEIMFDMGKQLRPELWPWDTVEDFFTEQLHTVYDWGWDELQQEVIHQQDFEYRKYETGGLRGDGEPGFDTPTGLIELKSSIYPMFGEEALPYFKEPELSPYSDEISEEVKSEYPLVLTSGARNISMFHSEHRQIPSLRAMNPWPMVTMHPDTAAKYGIEDGDWVAIENPVGRCVQKAKLRETVDPRVVHVEHAWWFPEQDGEEPNLFGNWKSNANCLTPHESVGVTGYGAPYKNVICKIYKVDSLDD